MVEKLFSEIEQRLKKEYPEFGEKAADEFKKALREMRDCRISSIELTYTCNLKLERMPMLIIDLEDGGQKHLIYDPLYGTAYEVNDFEYVSDTLDYWNIDSLDPNIDYFELPYSEVEELQYYGNRFDVIFDAGGYCLKIGGIFLDKVVAYEVPDEVFAQDLEDDVIRIINEIKAILATYSFKHVDPWRGYYEGKSAGGFIKVVEGWIGLGSSDPAVEKLAKVHKLEEEPPCTPILFVFPRSSNVCVTYFDVYVRKSDVEKFKNWFGDVDRFSFSEGINIRTTYDSA